jgi:hypothetical protein
MSPSGMIAVESTEADANTNIYKYQPVTHVQLDSSVPFDIYIYIIYIYNIYNIYIIYIYIKEQSVIQATMLYQHNDIISPVYLG